jgi:hypothetical protein
MLDIKRREFITLLGGATAASPLVARAQTKRMRRIGVLMGYVESGQEAQAFVAAFREGLILTRACAIDHARSNHWEPAAPIPGWDP